MNRKSSEFAIYCSNEYGPVFGNKSGYDICITNNCSKENSCTILNNGSLAYNCNDSHKSSLFNNSNKFTVLDYEVYYIENFKDYIYNICTYPDIVWNYIQTKNISDSLLRNVEEEQDLLNDLNLIHNNDDNIRLKVLIYLKNPSQFLPNTKIVGNQYDNVLREWIGDYQWKLFYRASEHEYTPESFHKNCDGKSPTLIIIKSTDGWIFGGYTTRSWTDKYRYEVCDSPCI